MVKAYHFFRLLATVCKFQHFAADRETYTSRNRPGCYSNRNTNRLNRVLRNRYHANFRTCRFNVVSCLFKYVIAVWLYNDTLGSIKFEHVGKFYRVGRTYWQRKSVATQANRHVNAVEVEVIIRTTGKNNGSCHKYAWHE